MSVAYYIVLDNEDVDFETFVDGKGIAQSFEELTLFCSDNNVKSIEHFIYQDLSEFMDELEGIDISEQTEKWFEAQEGISWAKDLIDKLNSKPPGFPTKEIIEDLKCYTEVFENAQKIDAKWHLALDF